MNVDHTELLKALKNEKGRNDGDISDEDKMKVAEDVHDYVTRRMGTVEK